MTTVLLVTCSEPDAVPYLRSLPADEVAQTHLVATRDVLRSVEHEMAPAATSLFGGPSSLDPLRALTAQPGVRVAIVIARDPWGPFNGKGFVRARLLAPWALAVGARADLVELHPGGRSLRTRPGLGRDRLTLALYGRELRQFGRYLALVSLGRPAQDDPLADVARAMLGLILAPLLASITLLRLIPFVLWTEARARRLLRRR